MDWDERILVGINCLVSWFVKLGTENGDRSAQFLTSDGEYHSLSIRRDLMDQGGARTKTNEIKQY